MKATATITRFDRPYEEGSRTIMPVHIVVEGMRAVIDLRAPRSAVNLLWSLAPQYAGRTINLEFETMELIGGIGYLRGVRILR